MSAVLDRAFPADPLIGEEDSSALRSDGNLRSKVVTQVRSVAPELFRSDDDILSAIDRGEAAGGPEGRCWALDPIDGTKGFLRGDQYAVALALIENGQVVLGVLGCPNLPRRLDHVGASQGSLFIAVRGQGAKIRSLDAPTEAVIRVSQENDVSQAVRCESVESGHSRQDTAQRIADRLGASKAPQRIDSQAKYGVLARGEVDVYTRLPTKRDYQEKIWDHAAGAIVVEEGRRQGHRYRRKASGFFPGTHVGGQSRRSGNKWRVTRGFGPRDKRSSLVVQPPPAATV